jgi:hypothetical protein
MSKVIKLKQEDLERIVGNIVKEQEWKGSTDPEIMQLGQTGGDELSNDEYDDMEDSEKDTDESGIPLRLAKDENGNYYVIQDDGGDKPKIFKINK